MTASIQDRMEPIRQALSDMVRSARNINHIRGWAEPRELAYHNQEARRGILTSCEKLAKLLGHHDPLERPDRRKT